MTDPAPPVTATCDDAALLANARLIAAAPDLLAALTHVADWFTAAGIDVPAARHARATIAIATGADQ